MRLASLMLAAIVTALLVTAAAHADAPSAPKDAYTGDVIVYTANQSWLSRIYVLRMDGSVLRYFQYDYYIFSDLEVVDNEVYATDWVAPRVYKIDIETGELTVIVDDWSLYYMYDLAWDGSHFYLKEWSLNRYELDGSWAGSTSFSEDARGGAHDGTYYWTLNDEGHIKCWDVSGWPTVVEVPANAFDPPSPDCRGLWFDGRYFWTAERIDGALGWIYQFDYDSRVVRQWREPAFAGYAACLIRGGIPGDIDGDGDVDLTDFATFAICYGYPVTPPAPGCSPDEAAACDLNDDGAVELNDFATFALHFSG